VPDSLALLFDIDLSGGYANNFLVQSVTRALVEKLLVKFAGTVLQQTAEITKQPKSNLFPNKAITNFLTIIDQFRYYLCCQRSAKESLIIS